MDARLISVAGQFSVGTNLVPRALHDVSNEQLRQSPTATVAPMLWIAGHLILFRMRTLNLLGGSHDPDGLTARFDTGSHFDASAEYPDREALIERWGALTLELTDRLDAVPPDALTRPPHFRAPSTDGTLAGALFLFSFHEAYHVGQLGYLRRWLGLPGLLG